MSKNLKILLILVVVCAAVYFVFVRKPWTTLQSELKDFAIKDTASVTKFFLADKRGHSVTVAKNEQGTWMVDNTYKADIVKVNLLLATMHDVTVRNPISEKQFNSVIATLATEGIKAEFYSGDKNIKTVYVGPGSADQSGTFMLIEGSSAPFVTHIDGFVGYLTPRFYTLQIKWKSKEVFNVPDNEIAKVTVNYPHQPGQSFEITNGASIEVKDAVNNKTVATDPQFARYYLASFGNLFFEGYDEELSGRSADSIHNTKPYCIIELTKKNNEKIRLQLHYKAVGDHTKILYDADGKLLPYDTEKFYGFINEEKEVVYVQEYNFGKVLKKLSDFAGKKQMLP
ncbi:MAG: DUF4340 domain-containing protein [Bacteroidota bacterium]